MTPDQLPQCPWKLHWGVGQESTTQCAKRLHVQNVTIMYVPDGRFYADFEGDPEHDGPSGVWQDQRVTWQAGDRREYTGDWPGFCAKLPGPPYTGGGCTLHTGHHGRCAP